MAPKPLKEQRQQGTPDPHGQQRGCSSSEASLKYLVRLTNNIFASFNWLYLFRGFLTMQTPSRRTTFLLRLIGCSYSEGSLKCRPSSPLMSAGSIICPFRGFLNIQT